MCRYIVYLLSIDCSPSCCGFDPEFPLIALWVLGSFGLSFHFTKTLTFGKPELHQEAAGARRSTEQNNINKSINSESLFKLSGGHHFEDFQCPEAELWNCCCSVRTWYDRHDPAPGGFCCGGAFKCVDIMLSSHTNIVSHSALFRFLWFILFCFVLPCCVIFCFGGIKAPWGGFIPPKGVVLSPTKGGCIPPKGWFYPP